MLQFIDSIIFYSLTDKLLSENIKEKALATDILLTKYIDHEGLSISLNETDVEFALTLYKDSNAIVSKTQVYFSSYNTTFFKYKAATSGKYLFNFLRP